MLPGRDLTQGAEEGLRQMLHLRAVALRVERGLSNHA